MHRLKIVKAESSSTRARKLKFALRVILTCTLLTCGNPSKATGYVFTLLESLMPLPYVGVSVGFSINNSGQVAGISYPFQGGPRSVVWNGKYLTVLDSLSELGEGALAINDAGHVAGWGFSSQGGSAFAAKWIDGAPIELDRIAAGQGATAYAINATGQVVGVSDSEARPDGKSGGLPVIWNGTTATALRAPDAPYGGTYGINDAGQVVGNVYNIGDKYLRAAVWNGLVPTLLDSLGGTSIAFAINNSTQIVGASYTVENIQRAVIWNGTSVTALDSPSVGNSYATSINSAGQIVGRSAIAAGVGGRATLWNGGNAIDLNAFLDANFTLDGWVLEEAKDINDSGQITGYAINSNTGEERAFLLSPVPEPKSMLMLLLGVCALGWRFRRISKEIDQCISSPEEAHWPYQHLSSGQHANTMAY